MNFVTSISLVVLGAMFLALLGWGSMRAAWRNCEGRRGVFAALAILAAICSIVAQKPSPDTPTITVDALLRDVGCYATNNVFHAAVTNAPSYAGVDFSDCDLMVYARERASSDAASWFELTPRKKFSQQPADYAIENATNFNYMVYLNYVPPSPVHTNGVFELYGFVIENEAQGEPDQLAAGFINSRTVPLPFDAEVEYLESSGTQWIDTGYAWTTDTTVIEITFNTSYMSRNVERNWFSSSKNNTKSSGAYSQNATSITPYIGTAMTPIAVESNTDYTLRIQTSGIAQPASATLNSTTYTQRQTTTVVSGITMGVFTKNDSDASFITSRTSSFRIYKVTMIDNNTLVRDFIPVRVGTTGALYDKRGVGGMNPDGTARNDGMYFNRGTGNFSYGNDK